jgi:hypothetical protein
MAKAVGVTRTGSGSWHFATQSKKLEGMKMMVGWFESARYDDGTPVAAIAAIQEYGSPKRSIPPRPFILPTIKKNGGQWREDLKAGARGILEGTETAETVMSKMGNQVAGQIQEQIALVTTPPLSPITLALRKIRRETPNVKIGGRMIGQVAAQLAAGEIDISGENGKPLIDTGFMMSSVTWALGVTE